MRSVHSVFLTAAALGACAGLQSLAATSAYWTFDDKAPGVLATTLVSEVNGDVLVGQAKNTGGTARNPAHNADVPGTNIFNGLYGALLNADNSSSLYFTNAAAFPAQTNSLNGSYVEVTNVTSLLCPTNFTIEFFVKVARDVNWPCLVGKERENNGASWCIDMDISDPVKLRMDTEPLSYGPSNGFNQCIASVSVQDGKWHHIAVTYHSPTRKATLYIDYITQWSMTTTHEAVYTNNSLFFGKGAGSNWAFDGWMDEIRLSDTVLTPIQFLRTYAVPEDAQLYYSFDDRPPGVTATTLVCAANSPAMDGLTATSAQRPTFSADIPPDSTDQISQGYRGTVVNRHNTSALLMLNTGLPANTNSATGGQIVIPGFLHPSNFTVEVFFKINRRVNYPLLVGKVRTGSSPSWSLSVADSIDQVRCRFDTYPTNWDLGAHTYAENAAVGYNQGIGTGVLVNDGKWHHAAFSYVTATKTVKIYVDHVLKKTATTINPIVYTDGDILMGTGAGERAFDGWVDEMRITPRILEPDEFLYTVPQYGTVITLQ